MAALGKRLKELRESRHLRQKELAEVLGISRNTLASWEAGHRNPGMSAAQRLADYFGVSLDYLLGRDEPWQTAEHSPAYPTASTAPLSHTACIPVVGTIRAGEPLFAADNLEGQASVPVEDIEGGQHFFLRVKSDDMIGARIHGGDLVLVRQQETVESGDIAVVLVEGEAEAALRRLYRTDGKWLLQPENPTLRPAVVSRRQVRIIGKVVRVQFEV